jgi:hypothetical protein
MRIASRVVGVALALAGLVFLSLSVFLLLARPESVLADPGLGRRARTDLPVLVLGVGFILAGWYFFRLDVDKLDEVGDQPASRFAPFLLAHRRALSVIALVGFAISLIRVAAVCFGRDWPLGPSPSRGLGWWLSGAGSQGLGPWIWNGKPFPGGSGRL